MFVIIVGAGTRAALGCSKVCFSTTNRAPRRCRDSDRSEVKACCECRRRQAFESSARCCEHQSRVRSARQIADGQKQLMNHAGCPRAKSTLTATSAGALLPCQLFVPLPSLLAGPESKLRLRVRWLNWRCSGVCLESSASRHPLLRCNVVNILAGARIGAFSVDRTKCARGVFRYARHRFEMPWELLPWTRQLRRRLRRWSHLILRLIDFSIHTKDFQPKAKH